MSGVYADDLEVGRVYQLDSYTLTEDEIVEFAKTWDPQIFHVDKAAAEAGAYGGLIASGLHTLSIYQRLAVAGSFGEWNVIAGKRFSDVQFLRPVRPGDTLTGTLVIDAVDIDPRGRALVTTTAELVNDRGAAVLSVTVDAYVRTRPTG
ncbi:MaoC domain protein dehydratase [Gordonia bronchialis DSM 43247]|uniref:MaoC domain protein dehydratase n=1 Tax=Gordonia bronchialis (strain ATCC 25592 / DSM 43247 / BCRC 13721 / JCM 3198 / KCTC 3076 / NBRC 16047 / NCTC 10667) TaxID=526226 RepID=D0L3J1_GORB4|nr:MaoC/PaaZ C-terminal domain-containing protein [Gordonia bronchialis]ACY20190.1 MaoC domain protein dehydratase [Gordonia bronchialis DSM 43247]MCC3322962.1 MaoC family dehydratase N-terminal domain-containing protein [Gordonia bronchialis]QGS25982.1 dehydratase [Gordonia bronchialis]UAK37619.1 MaoC family dehydratase N-terminal domain-containing protein [Gordonia bronchialis]STQ62988.1 bifunctional aldehyde dehydrogenase/enoyl-CoA hydratase [Gordonia bronchialis]